MAANECNCAGYDGVSRGAAVRPFGVGPVARGPANVTDPCDERRSHATWPGRDAARYKNCRYAALLVLGTRAVLVRQGPRPEAPVVHGAADSETRAEPGCNHIWVQPDM